MAVLEYPTQQRLLLPWLGWCFALHFTGQRFRDSYQRFLRGDETVPLGVLHMESSGLKALITQRVSDGIETIRKLCGGHGYSALSGLPMGETTPFLGAKPAEPPADAPKK